jgi:hypothetical protein
MSLDEKICEELEECFLIIEHRHIDALFLNRGGAPDLRRHPRPADPGVHLVSWAVAQSYS